MNKNNYNNKYNNMNEGHQDYGNQEQFYQNNNNFTVPIDLQNNIAYENSNWSLLNQTGYVGNGNMEEFLSNDYNHYDNNGYIYNDYYGNEYSYNDNNYVNANSNNINRNNYNSSNNNKVSNSNANAYKKVRKDDVSLSVISDKLNANVDEELLYDSLDREYGKPQYGAYDAYNNKTVAIDIRGKQNINYNAKIDLEYEEYDDFEEYGSDYDDDYVDEDLDSENFSTVDTNSNYYNRNGDFDDKMMPTENLEFEDIYLVRNQLFDDEEKYFSFNDIISLGICVTFAIIIAFLIINYVAQVTVVNGHSMEYNFHDKEVVVLDKISYKLGDPERFDVVVFPVKKQNGFEYYIKRIIGLPGEKIFVDAERSQIYIDNKRLETDVYAWEPLSGQGKNIEHNDVILGIDEYYCMGDNRNNSQDSRSSSVGSVNRDDFLGKAIFKISPLSSFGLIDHYYNHDIRSGKKEAYDFYAIDTQ